MEKEYDEADLYIDLVTTHDDPATAVMRAMHNGEWFGARFTPGRQTVIADPSDAWIEANYPDPNAADIALAKHSISGVVEQLGLLLDKHCGGRP